MSNPAVVADPPLEGSPYELRVGLGRNVAEPDVQSAIASGDAGFIHSFTTGSAVDGPGIRLVAWTTLCMFRCKFCHNPDTWTLSNGRPVTLARATDELRKYANGLKAMKGGFTLSGGEPLMQARFAARLFAAAKELDVHTAIETNGFLGAELTDADLDNIDLVLLGIKTWDRERHRALTGRDNAPTLELARRLAARKLPVWVRFVLVPGLTDDPDDIARIAAFAAELGNVERVEVLPFHQMGRFKWQTLGIRYALEHTEPPTKEALEEACGIFRARGLSAD